MDMICFFGILRMIDVEIVGGKNVSIGEMIQGFVQVDVCVLGGFVIIVDVFWLFLCENQIEEKINVKL